ncbi:MAG TPA: DUF5916 domain-containing protein [Chitinophagaceae bacterium]|nr:DUF5916 domain-containing protein [Chitinophagaceae bacterium]
MKIKTILSLGAGVFFCLHSSAQNTAPRQLEAKRTNQKVKIDGLIDDAAWKDAAIMTDLVEFRPKVGAPENPETKTIAYLMYDDLGIYFGGFCYERTKDSIATELKGRDGYGANDYIGIIFDTYHDKINGFEYFITPLNEQWDAKMAPPQGNNNNGGEDFSWNAVWKSGAVIHNNGWSFEMFLPYSAIRFGKDEVQNWGLNITRRRRKTEQQFTWNPIDPNVNGFLTQEGIWTGITNIKPPVRLQFSPYFSVYANHYPYNQPGMENATSNFNGGMDVKYGINQAFTLDATLIPDFGQVQSDNQVLNLTPFEVKFNENRNFFTEGTELFNKGNLFYSRRIGGTPLRLHHVYNNLGSNETVRENPSESKLINASKISGRTQRGLGIGVLNAITKSQYAILENSTTKEIRKYQTDPLTNYNLFVLDQTLKNNSSISLVNTNVWRSGSDYDANVTAALFNFNDKKNTWNLGGKAAMSNLAGKETPGEIKTGYSQQLTFGKTSGRFNFNVWQELTDTKFSSNDLGYFTNNNFLDHGFWMGYKWIEPKSFYNRIFINLNGRYSKLFSPIANLDQQYQQSSFNFNINVQSKKLWWAGSFLSFRFRENDFYEPRQTGWFFRRGSSLIFGGWVESNNAKKYSISTEAFSRAYFKFYNGFTTEIRFNQSYRFNNYFSLSHSLRPEMRFNNIGYTYLENGAAIIFARRKVNTIENVLSAKYNFNNRMGINFRMRHYFSSVDNKEFFTLKNDGKLNPNSTFNLNRNQNVNFFNIDMVYTWQFAPGSFINIVWKNAVFDFDNTIERNYFKNFTNSIGSDQNNNLSLKVIYFLDYLQLKKLKNK